MKQKHFTLKDFSSDNYHLIDKDNKNFSAEHNWAVINGTIEEYEKMRYGTDAKVQREAGDRADILASWTKYKLDIGGGKQIEQWLGKEHFNRIAGEGIIAKIKMMESIDKLRKLQNKNMKHLPKGFSI